VRRVPRIPARTGSAHPRDSCALAPTHPRHPGWPPPGLLELLAEYRTAAEARDAAERGLGEHLSPTAQALGRTVSDAVTEMHGAENDLHVAELCRHLPGLAPAIRLVWMHVLDARLDRVGACCTDGGMIDTDGGMIDP